MKLYIGDFMHYYMQDQETDVSEIEIKEQVQDWEDELKEQANSSLPHTLEWYAYEGTLYEIEDDAFYHMCACALHTEAKKPITRIYSHSSPDKLYEKWENGFQSSKLSALLEADCWMPSEDTFLFAYVDPQGDEAIFSTLDDLRDCLTLLMHNKEKDEAIMKAKETAKELLTIIDESITQNTLLIQVN